MQQSHKIIGFINLLIFPLIVFLLINSEKLFGDGIADSHLAVLMVLAVFLNFASVNFVKFYRDKPYKANNLEKLLLWAPMANSLLLLPVFLRVVKQFIN